jgi:hypothetical protein
MNRSACLVLALIFLLTISVPGSAMSPAAAPTWNSTIYYYNPSTAGKLTASFVGLGTTPPDVNKDVPAHGFGQILVGSTGDFKGSAILSANIPLAAVYKQADAGSGAYAPVLYSSFDASQAGTSGKFYVPSVIHLGYYVSKIGIQNVENGAVNLVLDFYDAATGTHKTTLTPPPVAAEGSFVFEMTDTDVPGIGTSFDGSLVITATKVAGGTAARVVAAVEELQSQGQRSYAFEGSGNPTATIYMPSAVCRYTTKLLTSYFAVQNASSTDDATITVTYYSTAGAVLATHAAGTVKPGAKISINTCDAKVYTQMNGKFATAVIKSTQPVVVVGKVNSNDGLATAYLGQSAGSKRVLLPYLVFNKTATGSISLTTTQIIIMNVSTAAVSDAFSVKVNFYYKAADGSYKFQTTTLAAATTPLKKFGVISTLPRVSGAALDANGNYLGAVEVVTDQPVVVLARVTQTVTGVAGITTLGEDYGGIPATP